MSKTSEAASGIGSSSNAFCVTHGGSGHGVAVRYGHELDHALRAGAIIDQDCGPVSHIQRFFFDDDLRVAGTARGGEQNQCHQSGHRRCHVERSPSAGSPNRAISASMSLQFEISASLAGRPDALAPLLCVLRRKRGSRPGPTTGMAPVLLKALERERSMKEMYHAGTASFGFGSI
jgi:hypothetical protein